ncbi:MAG: sensitive to high expression protein 9 homolog [Candidatus Omnitrophica bacterium]|jgi:Flp pilus assembly pilin Flp|nr:sensitive to high expression protein 9 homolog [Candidatus Omnitrophota bacterium]
MRKIKNKAQGFIEYAVLVIIIAAALVAMKIYMGRSVQDKYRQAGDVFGEGNQYALGITQSQNTSKSGAIVPEPPEEKDDCPIILARIAVMRKELDGEAKPDGEVTTGLLAQRASLEATVDDLKSQILALQATGGDYASAIEKLNKAINTIEKQIELISEKITAKEAKIAEYNAKYPDCFKL